MSPAVRTDHGRAAPHIKIWLGTGEICSIIEENNPIKNRLRDRLLFNSRTHGGFTEFVAVFQSICLIMECCVYIQMPLSILYRRGLNTSTACLKDDARCSDMPMNSHTYFL